MANCRGRSGPLDDVLRAARALGLEPEKGDLAAIDAHWVRLAEVLRAHRAEATRVVAEETAHLEVVVADGDPGDVAESSRVEAAAAAAVQSVDVEIRRLEAQRGLLLRILNLFRLPFHRSRSNAWRRWKTEQLRVIDARVAERQARLARLRADPDVEVDRRVRVHEDRVAAFRTLLASREMIGARAEVRIAEELSQLSDAFEVLHHLHLRASHFVRHNGKPVVSAEVDHLIVGPTGVYLVETKCWGARFVSDGAFFDPFEQTDRAGLLCHVLLKEARLPAKVRQVVTPFASLPAPPKGSYTRVVAPDRLCRWIENGNATLGPYEVRVVAQFLWDNFGPERAPRRPW